MNESLMVAVDVAIEMLAPVSGDVIPGLALNKTVGNLLEEAKYWLVGFRVPQVGESMRILSRLFDHMVGMYGVSGPRWQYVMMVDELRLRLKREGHRA